MTYEGKARLKINPLISGITLFAPLPLVHGHKPDAPGFVAGFLRLDRDPRAFSVGHGRFHRPPRLKHFHGSSLCIARAVNTTRRHSSPSAPGASYRSVLREPYVLYGFVGGENRCVRNYNNVNVRRRWRRGRPTIMIGWKRRSGNRGHEICISRFLYRPRPGRKDGVGNERKIENW